MQPLTHLERHWLQSQRNKNSYRRKGFGSTKI